jgi:hypothetical protein
MSKSRTGRKGRIRLAVAGALGDIDTAVGDATIVDANGRLGTASGLRSADDDLTNAQILDYIQGQLNKPGTANAHFTQGEVRGPLLDAVDTQNGASGAITSATGGNFAAAAGETTAAAIAPLSTGATFAHYVLPAVSEAGSLAAAVTLAAGADITTATAATSQIVSTDLRGICYHNGGPGSDLVPLQHLGALAADDISASQIVINPTMATIWADSGVTSPNSIQVSLVGDGINASGAVSAEDGGDSLSYYSTPNTAATVLVEFNGRALNGNGIGGDGSEGMPTGAELKIIDENGDTLVTITAALTATNGLVAEDGATGNVQDKNFNVDSATQIYVVAHDSVGGEVAYPTGVLGTDSMGAFVGNLVAAITAWGTTYGAKVDAAQGTGGTTLPAGRAELTLTYNSLRGTDGNNSTNTAGAALTLTAYSSSGQVVVPAGGDGHDWMVAQGGATGVTHRRFGADDGTAGVTGTNFGTGPTTVSTTLFGTDAAIDIQDLPIRVVYSTDDAAREGLSSGIPAEKSAGFVIVWGPV